MEGTRGEEKDEGSNSDCQRKLYEHVCPQDNHPTPSPRTAIDALVPLGSPCTVTYELESVVSSVLHHSIIVGPGSIHDIPTEGNRYLPG